jgi:hypothetical protein
MEETARKTESERASDLAQKAIGLGEQLVEAIERKVKAALAAKQATMEDLSELTRLVSTTQRAATGLVREVRSLAKDVKRILGDMSDDERGAVIAQLVRELPVDIRRRHGLRLSEEDAKP